MEKASFGKVLDGYDIQKLILVKLNIKPHKTYHIINLLKRGVNSMDKDNLSILKEDVKISSKKKKDLLDLLPFINTCFHPFYKRLPAQDSLEIHSDLVEDEPEILSLISICCFLIF